MRLTNVDIELRPELGRALWNRDASVWGPGEDDPADRLGWLDLHAHMRAELPRLRAVAESARADGIADVVLLGMGGSSLAPEVFARTYGSAPGYPRLVVLDSTHPAQIEAMTGSIDPGKTLWLVSSKSGGTLETMSLWRYFFERTRDGSRYVAITDPGTSLEDLARSEGFREVFLNPPDIGGRYSALSLFGLVPAALIGADLDGLLDSAAHMAQECGPDVAPHDHGALLLGCAMGEFRTRGRDKLTVITSEPISSFGDWVEQLIAESTGKHDTGVVPIVGEPQVSVSCYKGDRFFVHLRLAGDDSNDAFVSALAQAGHPVAVIDVPGVIDLGAEMFRFEFATAVAGAVLGINAFDQPNVEAAKKLSRALLESGDELTWAADEPAAFFEEAKPGETAALLAFAARTPEASKVIAAGRRRLAERGIATMGGFGPRYLHSTGQLHKGGPPDVRALVILDAPATDLSIPDSPHGFARLVAAQAAGDVQALDEAGRHVGRTTWEAYARWARD